jgi:hypothetical protein
MTRVAHVINYTESWADEDDDPVAYWNKHNPPALRKSERLVMDILAQLKTIGDESLLCCFISEHIHGGLFGIWNSNQFQFPSDSIWNSGKFPNWPERARRLDATEDLVDSVLAFGLTTNLCSLNAFETCSMQITMITRWVPRSPRDTSYLRRQLDCEFCTPPVCKCA